MRHLPIIVMAVYWILGLQSLEAQNHYRIDTITYDISQDWLPLSPEIVLSSDRIVLIDPVSFQPKDLSDNHPIPRLNVDPPRGTKILGVRLYIQSTGDRGLDFLIFDSLTTTYRCHQRLTTVDHKGKKIAAVELKRSPGTLHYDGSFLFPRTKYGDFDYDPTSRIAIAKATDADSYDTRKDVGGLRLAKKPVLIVYDIGLDRNNRITKCNVSEIIRGYPEKLINNDSIAHFSDFNFAFDKKNDVVWINFVANEDLLRYDLKSRKGSWIPSLSLPEDKLHLSYQSEPNQGGNSSLAFVTSDLFTKVFVDPSSGVVYRVLTKGVSLKKTEQLKEKGYDFHDIFGSKPASLLKYDPNTGTRSEYPIPDGLSVVGVQNGTIICKKSIPSPGMFSLFFLTPNT